MINTLRITGVIAVLLAGVLFVFPVVFGVRSDQKVNEFLGSPGARERFEKAAENKAQNKEDRTSPLVQQAEAFALYLNPPKPASGVIAKQEKTTGLLPPPPGVSPKFKVFVTTYFPDNPEMSRALIDEPGRGRHWVNQSNAVGHLVIAQVKDGIVVVKNNGETYEVAVEKNPAPAAATPASTAAPTVLTQRDIISRSRAVPPAAANMPPLTTPAVAGVIPQPPASPERDAKLQELARQLIDVQRNSASSSGAALSDAEKTARAQELITKYRAAQRSVRVSPKEAKELGALGEESQQTQGEPNAPAATTGDSKIEAGSPDPNRSAGSNPTP